MNSATEVWARVLSLMEKELTPTSIKSWFDDVEPVALEDSRVVLYCPQAFKKEVIESRYLGIVKQALYELFSVNFDILLLGEGEKENYQPNKSLPNLFFGTEEYTFERFVVGNSNKFAHAAALAVTEKPGKSYNPLFIYGESGLGKTHLLYAIAHTIHMENPDFRIVYIRGDAFTNEMIQAIRNSKNQEFREKYRGADVFLMDDVQFIAGRDSTQEEMFHTFNTLYEAKKQIVFTSDRPPKEMPHLEDRLKTRFEWGLLSDILPPDYETRMAIIKNKAVRMGVELPETVVDYMAKNLTANVRQIEGGVKKIMALRDLLGNSIDEGVTRAVQDILKDADNIRPTAPVIIGEVCKFYNIENEALRGQGRTKDTAHARHIAIYLIRTMTSLSLEDIGREFDGRNHSTILNSITKIEKMKKQDPGMAEVLKDIKTNINTHYE